MVVKNAPLPIVVRGHYPTDSSEPFKSLDDPIKGRWIAKSYLNLNYLRPSSSHFWWLQHHILSSTSTVGYVWQPYNSKLPHYDYRAWLELISPKVLLYVGGQKFLKETCHLIGDSLELSPSADSLCQTQIPKEGQHFKMDVDHLDGSTSRIEFYFSDRLDVESFNYYLSNQLTPHYPYNPFTF